MCLSVPDEACRATPLFAQPGRQLAHRPWPRPKLLQRQARRRASRRLACGWPALAARAAQGKGQSQALDRRTSRQLLCGWPALAACAAEGAWQSQAQDRRAARRGGKRTCSSMEVVPMPSWPVAFRPQTMALPVRPMAADAYAPAAMVLILPQLGSIVTCLGPSASALSMHRLSLRGSGHARHAALGCASARQGCAGAGADGGPPSQPAGQAHWRQGQSDAPAAAAALQAPQLAHLADAPGVHLARMRERQAVLRACRQAFLSQPGCAAGWQPAALAQRRCQSPPGGRQACQFVLLSWQGLGQCSARLNRCRCGHRLAGVQRNAALAAFPGRTTGDLDDRVLPRSGLVDAGEEARVALGCTVAQHSRGRAVGARAPDVAALRQQQGVVVTCSAANDGLGRPRWDCRLRPTALQARCRQHACVAHGAGLIGQPPASSCTAGRVGVGGSSAPAETRTTRMVSRGTLPHSDEDASVAGSSLAQTSPSASAQQLRQASVQVGRLSCWLCTAALGSSCDTPAALSVRAVYVQVARGTLGICQVKLMLGAVAAPLVGRRRTLSSVGTRWLPYAWPAWKAVPPCRHHCRRCVRARGTRLWGDPGSPRR